VILQPEEKLNPATAEEKLKLYGFAEILLLPPDAGFIQ
jgi:hypothetical protein